MGYTLIDMETGENIGAKFNRIEEENEKLISIINEIKDFIKEIPNDEYIGYWKKEIFEILEKVEEK